MPGTDPAQAHLEILARQAGFPDYSTWQAWNAHRTAAIVGGSNTTAQQGAPAAPAQPPAPPENFFQHLMRVWSGAVR